MRLRSRWLLHRDVCDARSRPLLRKMPNWMRSGEQIIHRYHAWALPKSISGQGLSARIAPRLGWWRCPRSGRVCPGSGMGGVGEGGNGALHPCARIQASQKKQKEPTLETHRRDETRSQSDEIHTGQNTINETQTCTQNSKCEMKSLSWEQKSARSKLRKEMTNR